MNDDPSRNSKSVIVNTIWMLLAQGVRLVLQGSYFIIVARALGAEAFGAFVSVLALVGLLSPFAGLGFGNIIVKNVSRNPERMQASLGNAFLLVGLTGAFIMALLCLVKPILLSEELSFVVLVCVAVSDLFLVRTCEIAGRAFQATERMGWASLITMLLFVFRAALALWMFVFLRAPTTTTWAILYLASTVITTLITLGITFRICGLPRLEAHLIRKDLSEGFFFSVSRCGQNVNNNVDKIMLARMSTLEATGIYGAAYRLIDVAMAPIRSLLTATYARFFKHGEHGIGGSLKVATWLIPFAGGYGLLAMIGMLILAPVVPLVLGAEYTASIEALRWLAPIPFFKALHFLASDTGAGLQKFRTGMIFAAAGFNALLNIWLIPCYGWRGAAWSSLAADGLLMIGLWAIIVSHLRSEGDRKQTEMEHV